MDFMAKKHYKTDLDSAQITAIRMAILAGLRIQRDHPEIAEMYRDGKFIREIANELNIAGQYGLRSEQGAISAVGHALRGVEKTILGVNSYQGLISKDELENLCTRHNTENGKRNTRMKVGIHALTHDEKSKIGIVGGSIGGKECYKRKVGAHAADYEEQRRRGFRTVESKIGIFGLSKEERIQASRKGGEHSRELGKGIHSLTHNQLVKIGHKAGSATYRLRKGIYAFTDEQRSEVGRRGGRSATIARGMTPWVQEEIQFCYEIFQTPEYCRGTIKGGPNYKLVAEAVNSRFHNSVRIRNENAVKIALRKYISSRSH